MFEKETKTRHLDNMGLCRVGLEVHFKGAEVCYGNQKALFQRRQQHSCHSWCIICISGSGNKNGNNNGNNDNNNLSRFPRYTFSSRRRSTFSSRRRF